MPTPEELARENIDRQLTACGWIVQDRAALNLHAGRGVAAREFPLETGEADYLLFVDRKAVGVVEAKPEGVTLSGGGGAGGEVFCWIASEYSACVSRGKPCPYEVKLWNTIHKNTIVVPSD